MTQVGLDEFSGKFWRAAEAIILCGSAELSFLNCEGHLGPSSFQYLRSKVERLSGGLVTIRNLGEGLATSPFKDMRLMVVRCDADQPEGPIELLTPDMMVYAIGIHIDGFKVVEYG